MRAAVSTGDNREGDLHMHMRIGICDDDIEEAANLKKIVKEYLSLQNIDCTINSCSLPKVFLEEYQMLDLLFLDIEMPEYNGLEVAKEIRKKDSEMRIVFLTSHREYIQKAFVVRAYRYLYKPYRKREIIEVLENTKKEMQAVAGIYIEKKNGEQQFVPFRNILYMEALGDGVAVCLENGYIVTRKTLKNWMEILPEEFYQCHKSYIVNMFYIVKITNSVVILKKQKTVPVSVRKRKALGEQYFDYIRKNAREI